ncbi:hypothetical protein T08_7435 [Trichinella sp. T8]|nr:hypothetical protein T08_7435 [Trichinella sp. T8]
MAYWPVKRPHIKKSLEKLYFTIHTLFHLQFSSKFGFQYFPFRKELLILLIKLPQFGDNKYFLNFYRPFKLHGVVMRKFGSRHFVQWIEYKCRHIMVNHREQNSKFTDEEVELLARTWKKDDFDWLYRIGTDIYTCVFQLAPELKVFFPYVTECEKKNQSWESSKGFRTQALRFVQILGMAVEKTESRMKDDDSHLHHRLYKLGETHRRFALKGFTPTHWKGFVIAVRVAMRRAVEAMPNLTPAECETAIEAWDKLSRYVVHRMEEGYFGVKLSE